MLALGALFLALALMQYATGGRVAYTMDSLTYRDAALNFISGHPMQATNVEAPEPEFQQLLIWPPAYPAFWALMSWLGDVDIDNVPSLLNPVLLGITTLSVFLACWMATKRPAIAFAIATASAFTPSCMIIFGHAWSETLFIPLILLSYAALLQYLISREKFIWLAGAAILIGIANWVRYAGVAFLPVLCFSVLAASGAPFRKRIMHAAGAVLMSFALAFPLWLRNWQLTGSLSGSGRGGTAGMDRLFEDPATILDLVEHSFFAFSAVLRANLEIPIVIAIIFLVVMAFRRHGFRWLRLHEIWLPMVWLMGYLAFLLFARYSQKGVPLDLRMLAVAFPFLLLLLAPAANVFFTGRSFGTGKLLVALLLGLLIYSGLNEAHRTRENYLSAGVPRWRAAFWLGYRDMRNTSPTSRALLEQIGPLHPSTLVLTDYRALYIRYLTGSKAYSPYDDKDCARWLKRNSGGLLLIGAQELPGWAAACLREKPHWRLLRPVGRAAPSMYAD